MKNAKMTIVAVLVALVAVTTYSVSGTYAKYTETFTGTTSTATVAKWDIDLKDKDGASIKQANKSFTFDLFKTILDTAGAEENDVATGKIAPGTSGEFKIKLVNSSDVTATYKVILTLENEDDIPLNFTVNGTAATFNEDGELEIPATANLNMNGGEETVTIGWSWTFSVDDATDTSDTALGTAGTATVSVDAEVIVDQVD